MTLSVTVCYVLTSNGKDVYADMNLISAWSLRESNPTAKIIILCDHQTLDSLEEINHAILKLADQVISINLPSYSPSFRNRYMKTSARQYIKGPFLYLDADILVRDDITPIFSTPAFLSGVPNHSGTGSPSEIPATETTIFKQLNWPIPSKYYVNGGVLFFADNPDVYAFCNLWHQKWKECSTTFGKHYDQPSLNSAISESNINFSWLEPKFNAQVHARPQTAWGAAIWHIYLSDHHVLPKTVLEQLLTALQKGELVTPNQVAKRCKQSHPWIISNLIDWVAVQQMKNSKDFLYGNRWERLWLADQHFLALRVIIERLTKKREFQ